MLSILILFYLFYLKEIKNTWPSNSSALYSNSILSVLFKGNKTPDPLTLVLSILILFYLFYLKEIKTLDPLTLVLYSNSILSVFI